MTAQWEYNGNTKELNGMDPGFQRNPRSIALKHKT
jgi:hypothetical protein